MSHKVEIRVEVNGTTYERSVEPRILLSDFLRHDLELTGTHVGCEQGVCGACTILLDGAPVRSCLLFAVQVNGLAISTVESLAEIHRDGSVDLHPLQEAFWEKHGLQCGFCTPGFLMTLIPYLEENSSPSEADIREVISGNLCRCTGYHNIVEAALLAAESMSSGGETGN